MAEKAKKYTIFKDSVMRCYRTALSDNTELIQVLSKSGRHEKVGTAANKKEVAKLIKAHKNGK